jgi:hypothetical protein
MSFGSTSYSPDDLIAGDFPLVTSGRETIVSGETITRGTVLGRITASGKLAAVNDADGNGNENPYAVAAEDVDASAGDVDNVSVYYTGTFNENKLSFGGDDDVDDHREACKQIGIFFKKPVTAAGVHQ